MLWNEWRQPTYLPPRGDEIDIVLELAGCFRTTMESCGASTRRCAPRMPKRRWIQSCWAMLCSCTSSRPARKARSISNPNIGSTPATTSSRLIRRRSARARRSRVAYGRLAFGNYEFSLAATYNEEACTTPFNPKRQAEFDHAMQTAKQLIGIYLQPLRRKPSWL
jgi:hypothetical protein